MELEDKQPNTTIEDVLSLIDSLRAEIEELKSHNEKLTEENRQIRDFNRTLLNRRVDTPVPDDTEKIAKDKLDKYLKGE